MHAPAVMEQPGLWEGSEMRCTNWDGMNKIAVTVVLAEEGF